MTNVDHARLALAWIVCIDVAWSMPRMYTFLALWQKVSVTRQGKSWSEHIWYIMSFIILCVPLQKFCFYDCSLVSGRASCMFYILGVQALAMVGKLQTKNFKKIAVHLYVGELHDDKSIYNTTIKSIREEISFRQERSRKALDLFSLERMGRDYISIFESIY